MKTPIAELLISVGLPEPKLTDSITVHYRCGELHVEVVTDQGHNLQVRRRLDPDWQPHNDPVRNRSPEEVDKLIGRVRDSGLSFTDTATFLGVSVSRVTSATTRKPLKSL